MASVEYPDKEEHYLLRIHDSRAADRLREILRRPPGETISDLELKFDNQEGADAEARRGVLGIEGETYPALRQDLPTIVEAFKTYDQSNLVKCGDIGQVIIVPEKGEELPEGVEAPDGVTPPMRDARRRRFRRDSPVAPAMMKEVEDAVIKIISGSAPEGYSFVDEEEEYVVASNGRSGSWQPVQAGRTEQAPPSDPQKKVKRKYTKRAKEGCADPGAPQKEDAGMGVEEI